MLATACGTLPRYRNIILETSTLGAKDFCSYGTLSHANILYATENHLNGVYSSIVPFSNSYAQKALAFFLEFAIRFRADQLIKEGLVRVRRQTKLVHDP